MKTAKLMTAVIAICSITAFTGCKKDDVTPGSVKTRQKVVMDGGGPIIPPQLPPPPNP